MSRVGRLAVAVVLATVAPLGGSAASAIGTGRIPEGAVLAPNALALPSDPAAAAVLLVEAVLGPDLGAADAATVELLRRAGVPIVDADGPVLALPTRLVLLDATLYAELIPALRRSVAEGDSYRPDQFAALLDAVGAMPGILPTDVLVGGFGIWGKDPASRPETVTAGAAMRALSAARSEVLYPGANPDEIHLDLLQLMLVMAHLTGTGGAAALDLGETPPSGATWLERLAGIGQVQAASDPCKALERSLKEPDSVPYRIAKGQAEDARDRLIDAWVKKDPAGKAQRIYKKASEIKGKAGAIWSKGGDILNVALLLLGAQLDVDAQPASLHVRPEGGISEVRVTATASFSSALTQSRLPCYALAGINVPPDGVLSGYRVRWSISQAIAGAGVGKYLRAVSGDGAAFQATGGGGQVTGNDGKATVRLEPATERQPGAGKLDHATVSIEASLDKDDFPFKLSDLMGLRNPAGFVAGKSWDLIVSAASRVGLPTQRVGIDVAYHDAETYSIKGVRNLFAFYYHMPVTLDLYTCEGMDGRWQGTVKFHGDRDFFGEAANKVFGQHFPATVDQGYQVSFAASMAAGTVARVDLVGGLGGIIEMDTGWRALDRRDGRAIGRMVLTGDGTPLDSLAIFDGFDMSYPVTVGDAGGRCPPGGLYYP